MKHSETSSSQREHQAETMQAEPKQAALTKPQSNVSSWYVIAWLITSLAGFADAAYLTIEKIRGAIPPCSLLIGCEVVTTSEQSMLFGIPIALFGVLYYLAIFLGVILYFDTKKRAITQFISAATVLGFITSLYLIYLQLFILNAICIYCMFSALTSILLFLISLITFKQVWIFTR